MIRPRMTRPVATGLILAGVAALALWVGAGSSTTPPAGAAADPALVAKGRYLAQAADCAACHTAPDGGKTYAGGRAFKLPFGIMYSTNITADAATGIGGWSDDDFVGALQHGVGKGGRHLYPSMPYTSYTAMARGDALAIKAFLFSLAPVHAPARQSTFPFPFNQRWGMALWNVVFLKDRRFQADPALTAQQNRGAYLATALGHCGECHTPRNVAFGVERGRQFAGEALQGWRAYNITSDKTFGVGAWSDRQLVDYITTGHADGRGSASGPMGEAVAYSLQHLTPQDSAALVAYLRTVKPQRGPAGTAANLAPPVALAASAWAPAAGETSAGLGKHIFEGACSSCHQWNGQGQQNPYATLIGAQSVNDPSGMNVTQAVLHGVNLPLGDGAAFMPAFGKAYSDAEVAAVANYVIGRFGAKAGKVTPATVRKARQAG